MKQSTIAIKLMTLLAGMASACSSTAQTTKAPNPTNAAPAPAPSAQPKSPPPKAKTKTKTNAKTKGLRIVYKVSFDATKTSESQALIIKERAVRQFLMDEQQVKGASVMLRGRTIVVGIPAMTKQRMYRLRQVITQPSVLELTFVQEHKRSHPVVGRDYPRGTSYKPHEFMRDLAKFASADPSAYRLGITARKDAWQLDVSRERFYDHFLTASNRNALESYVASTLLKRNAPKLPTDVQIRFEHIRGYGWRSLLVRRMAALDGSHIATARVVFNPTTNFPEVLVTFTPEGAKRLTKATSANVGRRLAIIINGTIQSAPVIQAAIPGGRVAIAMGGTNAKKVQFEAMALVEALRLGKTPASLEEQSVQTIEPYTYDECMAAITNVTRLAAAEAKRKGVSPTVIKELGKKLRGDCTKDGTLLYRRRVIDCWTDAKTPKDVTDCINRR